MSSIKLSRKHGLNPTLLICLYCGEETGELALLGRLRPDVEAPRYCCLDETPCQACTEKFSTGTPIFSICDGHRTGAFVVLNTARIADIFTSEVAEHLRTAGCGHMQEHEFNEVFGAKAPH